MDKYVKLIKFGFSGICYDVAIYTRELSSRQLASISSSIIDPIYLIHPSRRNYIIG